MKCAQKILALLFVLAFAFACMAGCAPKVDPTEPSGTAGAAEPTRQEEAPTGTESGSNEATEPTTADTEPVATEGNGSDATESPAEVPVEDDTEPATEGDTGATEAPVEAPTEEPTEPLPTLDESNLGQWVG